MAESKSKLYKRKTVEKKLNELLERISQLNEEISHPEFTCFVDEMVAFGSYINTDNEKIHDLDIAIRLKLKPRYNNNIGLASREAQQRAPENIDFLRKLCWSQEEVYQYLKNRCGIYSFHLLDEERKIVESDIHKVLVKNGKLTGQY